MGNICSSYTEVKFPDQTGKTYVITGANCGLGLAASKVVAKHGARVIMVGRNAKKGAEAIKELKQDVGESATVEWMTCDLSDLDSVKLFVNELKGKVTSISGLLNNAGVMLSPIEPRTKQGHEMQFGTNHLGHFALTVLLVPLLKAENGRARVVCVSSIAAKQGKMNWDDLDWKQTFDSIAAYRQSKLANLLFSTELERKLKGTNIEVIPAHPGVTNSNLGRHWPILSAIIAPIVGMQCDHGCLSEVTALLSDDTKSGDYWGPRGLGEASGMPTLVEYPPLSLNQEDAVRLWKISEEATGARL